MKMEIFRENKYDIYFSKRLYELDFGSSNNTVPEGVSVNMRGPEKFVP